MCLWRSWLWRSAQCSGENVLSIFKFLCVGGGGGGGGVDRSYV
jgi:hypothetical protein